MNQFHILFYSFSNFIFSLPFTLLGMSSYNKNEIRADWQPPGFVFGIVWPILYFIFGIINLKTYFSTWSLQVKNTILNNSMFESIMQTLWLVVTANTGNDRTLFQHILGFFVIIFLVYYAYFVRLPYFRKVNTLLFYLYIPYCMWIFFASILNFQLIKNSILSISNK